MPPPHFLGPPVAKYNEILVGRYNRYLQKLLGMKGQAHAPQLSSEISVNLQLFNGVETRYLEGWNRFSTSMNVAAVAALLSGAQLRNPAASNVILVIEKLFFAVGAAREST